MTPEMFALLKDLSPLGILALLLLVAMWKFTPTIRDFSKSLVEEVRQLRTTNQKMAEAQDAAKLESKANANAIGGLAETISELVKIDSEQQNSVLDVLKTSTTTLNAMTDRLLRQSTQMDLVIDTTTKTLNISGEARAEVKLLHTGIDHVTEQLKQINTNLELLIARDNARKCLEPDDIKTLHDELSNVRSELMTAINKITLTEPFKVEVPAGVTAFEVVTTKEEVKP